MRKLQDVVLLTREVEGRFLKFCSLVPKELKGSEEGKIR